MFHTPPIKSQWTDSSAENSYRPKEEVDIPETLQNEVDSFARSLKEPRFSKPLDLDEIAALFKNFYAEYNTKAVEYVKALEVEDPDSKIYKLNLLAENVLCETFYKDILFSRKKRLKSDEQDYVYNDILNKKLALLAKLHIGLDHLDMQLPLEKDVILEKLHSEVLPVFDKMTNTKSPTGKMKCLLTIHESINTITNGIVNADHFLPLLIYTIINVVPLHSMNLFLQLQFIKRFHNENIGLLRKGQLFYVLTNLDASLTYLAGATLDDLRLDPSAETIQQFSGLDEISDQQYAELLSKPIMIGQEMSEPTEKSVSRKNSIESRPSAILGTSSEYGIRTISAAFDASFKNIFGRFSAPEEQIIEEEQKLTPTSSLNSENSQGSLPKPAQEPQLHPFPDKSAERVPTFSKFTSGMTSGMNGVIRNWRPALSNSSSTTSLPNTENPRRSRGSSLLNGTLFSGANPTTPQKNGLINTFESAFETFQSRSRGNSNAKREEVSDMEWLKRETAQLSTHLEKDFENLSVAEMRQVFSNYKRILGFIGHR